MIKSLLSRAIQMLCLGGIAVGMGTAMAQQNPETLQHVVGGGYWGPTVTGSADPEGEVTTGTDPPLTANNFPELEVGSIRARPDPIEVVPENDDDVFSENIDRMAANADPESEVGNGMKPSDPINIAPETEDDDNSEIEPDNFPELYVGDGAGSPV